jgi:hypothetical protein
MASSWASTIWKTNAGWWDPIVQPTKPTGVCDNGARKRVFDPRDPRFDYVALSNHKTLVVCKLDTGAYYELPVRALASAEEYDGSVPVRVDTLDAGAAAMVEFESGVVIDFPVDFVLHHCAADSLAPTPKSGIGQRVRAARKERQHTLAVLSKLTGIAVSNLSRLEHGGHTPRITTLQQIAKALRVPVTRLISG